MNTALTLAFVAYLLALLVIGLAAYRTTHNLADYILGGRRLGPGTTALSAGASDMSGWLLLGLPGAVYLAGLEHLWMAVGLAVGAYLNWQFVAERLRTDTVRAGNAVTLPAYFENRFGDRTRLLRAVSALVILVFFTFYTSAGLVASGTLFEATFGVDYHLALALGALVILAYTLLGGFLAVSWTDLLQGLLMFVALLLVPIVAVHELGGWHAATQTVSREAGPAHLDAFTGITTIGVFSLLAWGLGYFGQPHILARFMAIRDVADIPAARFIGITWMVLALYGALFTGLVGTGYFAEAPLENPEAVFLQLTEALFNPWIAGFLLAAVLAAIMSTIDSQLLVSSSALSEDFYKRFLRPGASDRELVWIGRAAVLVIGLIAIVLAADPEAAVLDLVAYAWAGFGAAFGPVILLALFWRRTTRNGALGGIAAGAATVIIWASLEGNWFELYELLPGFLFGGSTVIVISLLDRRRIAPQPAGRTLP